MKRKLAGLGLAALLVAALVFAPHASAQFGRYDCRYCTRICWTGAWILESCEWFCVSESHSVGYSECYDGPSGCQQYHRCVVLVA